MPKPKGSPKTGGRKPNTPNAVPAMLRDMIIGVLMAKDDAEAHEINPWMADLKYEYKPVFAGLLSKIIPKEMAVEVTETIKTFTLNMNGLDHEKKRVNSVLPQLARIGVDDTEIIEGEVSSVE